MMRTLYGCCDGNCVIRRPEGQHTNGGCQCLKSLRYQDGQKEFREGMALLHAVAEAARTLVEAEKQRGEMPFGMDCLLADLRKAVDALYKANDYTQER